MHAPWASSATEVVGFGRGSDLPLSAAGLLLSPCAGLYLMMCCWKGVALLRGWCDSKHPGHQQLVGTGKRQMGLAPCIPSAARGEHLASSR